MFEFNYWSWFKVCVKHINIQPSEAWGLDFVEASQLVNEEKKEEIDLTIMLNFERVKNGASKQWLQNN